MAVSYIVFLAIAVAVSSMDYDEEWGKFKHDNQKSYRSLEEDQQRFSIFKDNFDEIGNHNKNYEKGLVTYKKAVNIYADLTPDEFRKLYGLIEGKVIVYNDTTDSTKSEFAKHNNESTEFLDWRQKGAVTSVKDQRPCGSCWIFSAIGVLEAYYFRKYNKLISLSAQNMVDCISNYTCTGGWPPGVFLYVKKHGINTEENYPYEGTHSQCRYNESKNINITFKDIVQVSNNEIVLKRALAENGPLSVSLYASSKWMFYESGVWYEKECSEMVNHSVLLVGYGRENDQDYWLIKNTMGSDWGEKGYIKIARNKHNNYCGLTSWVFSIK